MTAGPEPGSGIAPAAVPRRSASGMKRSMALLVLAEMAAMSLWFVSAAVVPEIQAEAALSAAMTASLSSAVQVGFVIGALLFAVHGTPDRYDPRAVFAVSALGAALCNAALLVTPLGDPIQVVLRGLTGAFLAGVYPVGMKIAVGWSVRRRGLLVGLIVGALTLGSAAPHLIAFAGGADWRFTVSVASLLAVAAAGLIAFTRLGPLHATAPALDPAALKLVWTQPAIRLAYLGYLCHMWELYAFWAWIAVAAAISFGPYWGDAAGDAARLTAFAAIALGALVCVPVGAFADRLGKARLAGWCLAGSAAAAFATALSFAGPPWLMILCILLWGALVIPDSAQFSALVADAAPQDRAGSLMTFQTALGFLLTAFTVQAAPMLADRLGWAGTLAILGIGPVIGVEMMRRLHALRWRPATPMQIRPTHAPRQGNGVRRRQRTSSTENPRKE